MSRPYFDPIWLDIIDPMCREIARLIFAQVGFYLKDHHNELDVDLVMYHDTMERGVIEVEYVSPVTDRFLHDKYKSHKHKGISIPGRKAKWFRKELGWWMNFSSDLTHYIILPGSVVIAGLRKPYPVWNNNVPEHFYLVDLYHPHSKRRKIAPGMRNHAIDKICSEKKITRSSNWYLRRFEY